MTENGSTPRRWREFVSPRRLLLCGAAFALTATGIATKNHAIGIALIGLGAGLLLAAVVGPTAGIGTGRPWLRIVALATAVLIVGVGTVAAFGAHFANSPSPSTVFGTPTARAPGRPPGTVTTTSPTLTATRIAPAAVTLAVGETQQFTAVGAYSDGSTTDITHSVVWNVTDPSVAMVDSAGRVTAVSLGVTELLAMSLPPCAADLPPCNVMAPAARVLITVR
jgi:hypothetical protein